MLVHFFSLAVVAYITYINNFKYIEILWTIALLLCIFLIAFVKIHQFPARSEWSTLSTPSMASLKCIFYLKIIVFHTGSKRKNLKHRDAIILYVLLNTHNMFWMMRIGFGKMEIWYCHQRYYQYSWVIFNGATHCNVHALHQPWFLRPQI
jgi:hypothetical protein